MTKTEARAEILQKVNRFALGFRRVNAARSFVPPTRLYGARNINEAVCVARRRRLAIKPEVFEAAGFRSEERR